MIVLLLVAAVFTNVTQGIPITGNDSRNEVNPSSVHGYEVRDQQAEQEHELREQPFQPSQSSVVPHGIRGSLLNHKVEDATPQSGRSKYANGLSSSEVESTKDKSAEKVIDTQNLDTNRKQIERSRSIPSESHDISSSEDNVKRLAQTNLYSADENVSQNDNDNNADTALIVHQHIPEETPESGIIDDEDEEFEQSPLTLDVSVEGVPFDLHSQELPNEKSRSYPISLSDVEDQYLYEISKHEEPSSTQGSYPLLDSDLQNPSSDSAVPLHQIVHQNPTNENLYLQDPNLVEVVALDQETPHSILPEIRPVQPSPPVHHQEILHHVEHATHRLLTALYLGVHPEIVDDVIRDEAVRHSNPPYPQAIDEPFGESPDIFPPSLEKCC